MQKDLNGATQKKISEYLHYYLGQDCEITAPDGIPYEGTETINLYWIERVGRHGGKIKPILRKLESMTEEEMLEVTGISKRPSLEITRTQRDEQCIYAAYRWKDEVYPSGYGHSATSFYFKTKEFKPLQFHYLLSRGFDLFGLIESGAAINKEQQ